jgi:hypothetical protein
MFDLDTVAIDDGWRTSLESAACIRGVRDQVLAARAEARDAILNAACIGQRSPRGQDRR